MIFDIKNNPHNFIRLETIIIIITDIMHPIAASTGSNGSKRTLLLQQPLVDSSNWHAQEWIPLVFVLVVSEQRDCLV